MTERTVDMWEHLPSFLKKFRELYELIEAEEPQFQLLVENQIKLLDNIFILTADSTGLKRFESILNLYPSADDDLETRRKNVLSHWFITDAYTLQTLKTRLALLQGNDNIQVVWDDDDCHLLHITTRLDFKGQVDMLVTILEEMLPANIAYTSTNYIEFEDTVTNYYGVGMIGTGYIFLTNDFNQTVSGDVSHYVGAGMVGTGTFFLTNDFNEEVDISGNEFVGMANSYTEIITSN